MISSCLIIIMFVFNFSIAVQLKQRSPVKCQGAGLYFFIATIYMAFKNLGRPRVLLRTYYFTCVRHIYQSCKAKQICRAVYFHFNGKVKRCALKNNRKYVYCHSYIYILRIICSMTYYRSSLISKTNFPFAFITLLTG